MAVYRQFRFHPGGGTLEYDDEGAKGIVYGREVASTNKVVSPSIGKLIRTLEWCEKCDLELPEPIDSQTIEASVLKAVRRGQMNLTGMSWSLIAGRLKESRCPSCGAFVTHKMVDTQLQVDTQTETAYGDGQG